jgi:hypothetical protein
MNLKRISLFLLLAIFCIDNAAAQDWWRGTLGPAPPEPPSKPVDSDTRTTPNRSYRREPTERPRRVEPPRPKPPSKAELRQREAERQRTEAQKQQIRGEFARLSGSFKIQRIQPSIELTPRGSDMPPDDGKRPFGQIMVAPLAGIGTPASRIPTENLRRAAAVLDPILKAFKQGDLNGMSEEDMSFLAGQSALAMEGAPLSVAIVDVPSGREEQVRHLAQQAQDIEAARTAAQQATTERLRIEERLVKMQQELSSGKGDTKALSSEREKLLVSYKSAWTAENDKKNAVQTMTGKVTVVWEPAR